MSALAIEEKQMILSELNIPSIEQMNEKESEKILEGKKHGTYLLRTDSKGTPFLSGIDFEGEFHHARIERKDQQWGGSNGGVYHAEHLKKLVCLCLKCEDIHPLFFVKQ